LHAPGAEGDRGVQARDARYAAAGRHPAATGRRDRPLPHARLLSARAGRALRQRPALPRDRRPPQPAGLGAEGQPEALAQHRDRLEVVLDAVAVHNHFPDLDALLPAFAVPDPVERLRSALTLMASVSY